MYTSALLLAAAVLACSPPPIKRAPAPPPPKPASVVAIGKATPVTIVVTSEVAGAPLKEPPRAKADVVAKIKATNALRESVGDLERVLHDVAGATVRVALEPRAGDYTIWIGDAAPKAFGPVGASDEAKQGFRVAVTPEATALFGESDLASSYAIYELLFRLGCRWYFPSDLGESLPPAGTIGLAVGDDRRVPSTLWRGVWYADHDWVRRNRQGGLLLMAGHMLSHYPTPADYKAHPEWLATVAGKTMPNLFRWSPEGVAELTAERLIELNRKEPARSWSLSVEDGDVFDESAEDRALDTGDFDPMTNKISVTDRYLVLANRIATRVTATYPDLELGFLAYGSTMRVPRRERPHPSLVPQIAPITGARAHPMDDDRVPHNRELREIVEGWGKIAKRTSMYMYAWFLADPGAPNPMLTKWGHDVPYVLANGVGYWQPETIPNFETSMYALHMSMRVAFDRTQRPEDIFNEMNDRLYGPASGAMSAYWRFVDDIWTNTPEYAGGWFGQRQRFTPARLARMRELLTGAAAAAGTEAQRRRIALAEESLSLLEESMAMREDFAHGNFAQLDTRGAAYKAHVAAAAAKWSAASTFGLAPRTAQSLYASYFDSFHRAGYEAGAKIAATGTIFAKVTTFRFAKGTPDALAPAARELDDASWQETDVTRETWSSLGLYDHFGSVWYRAHVRGLPRGELSLWLGSVVGQVRVFVNGQEAPHAQVLGGPAQPVQSGGPLTFAIGKLVTGGDDVVAIVTTRKELDEVGVGGLTGPVIAYRRP